MDKAVIIFCFSDIKHKDWIRQRKVYEEKLHEMSNSNMETQNTTGPMILNNSSVVSSMNSSRTSNDKVELCQTCQTGIGGVNEAAKKIQALALGMINVNIVYSDNPLIYNSLLKYSSNCESKFPQQFFFQT